MRQSRNPFRLRRSENIDTDTEFLALFEPGILDVLTERGLPSTVQLIRSAAGGGKTSLLRLFTPTVLRTLHARRNNEQELFGRVQGLGAIGEQGPQLLGVTLLCGRNYAVLEDLPVDRAQKTRLFLGLLNARIILAVLRSALLLKGLEYPNDLDQIQIAVALDPEALPFGLELPSSGGTLHRWARNIERSICAELDSFGPMQATSLPGHDALFALSIVRPSAITIAGVTVAERIVIMMDDIHMLTTSQRSLLIERVVEARSSIGIWIAERFEALSTQELLASGSEEGRDHDAPIELEWFWRRRHERFERHVMRLADRRASASAETELDIFRTCLEDDLNGPSYEAIFERAAAVVEARVAARVGSDPQFRDWYEARRAEVGSPREQAMGWRTLEILIERVLRRPQKGLFDDTPRDPRELNEKDDSPAREAAELFLAREFSLPYYYGADRIARLASLNIQQFLGLGASIFEEVLAGELLRGGTQVLSARRQHGLMKKAAQAFWEDIPNRVRHGRELRAFIDSVGRWSTWYTYRPSAPNDPGVGGTALRMSERRQLQTAETLARRPDYARLADLLASGLAHNYLVADLDYKCKGELWMVLNLNRLLCVYYDLPLGYGLYKERPLDELCRWVNDPFAPPRQDELGYD
ncbi:MAG TPA: hypothetical protein VN700_18155 [Vicinamibacterales bacterium]|nr:hypothetical protein [Vicinamibacterales bacterium]